MEDVKFLFSEAQDKS